MRSGVLVAVALLGCAHGNNSGPDAAPADGPAMDAGCDGLPCRAIYVAPTGTDVAAGTKDAPLKTIGAAIAKAGAAVPPDAVFVQAGSYAGAIEIRAGMTIYGGFDAQWSRDAAATTEIVGASPALTISAVTTPCGLDHVTIKSADATAVGASSIAVLVTGSALVDLREVTLLPGQGAPGADGVDGPDGDPGTDGKAGGPGVEHSSSFGCDNNPVPLGGAGGTSSCERDGGAGGLPGVGSAGGAQGDPGVGGTPGGPGGASTKNGTIGSPGSSGTPGMSGAGGAEVGMFIAGTYVPARGGDGTNGIAGAGGGGGGGGGGGTNNCDSSGSSGGGGGGGGCGAGLGTGGSGGGGSFALVAVDSHVNVKSSTITAGTGGHGGRGGIGGSGGSGGRGGPGGRYGGSADQDDGGNGAAGGRGGDGGNGGHGGGGGGGPSAAVVCVGMSAITAPQTTLAGGTGGEGGASFAHPGAIGVSTRSIGCSFF